MAFEPGMTLILQKNCRWRTMLISEGAVEAAVREVREEAGISSIVIDSIGTARYQLQQKDVSVQFLLMVFGGKSEQRAENSEKGWFAYEEAFRNLECTSAKDILKKANTMIATVEKM